MTDHEASKIIQNLVEIHRTIHWGQLSDTEHISPLVFYYRSFSEYAVDLDNYLSSTKGDNGRKDDLEKFESDVRVSVKGMVKFISNYNIDLTYKEHFIERSNINEVFEILNIDKNEVLSSIRENHEYNKEQYREVHLSYFTDELNSTRYDKFGLKAVENVKAMYENEDTKFLDMAIRQEWGNLKDMEEFKRKTYNKRKWKEKFNKFKYFIKAKIKR